MALHLYEDEQLTRPLSEGDMTAPDFALFDGEHGSYADKQLYVAVEHTALTEALTDSATLVQVQDTHRFRDGETIIVDDEQMLVLSGGGTQQLTVQRGHNETSPVSHEAGKVVYSGYNYLVYSVAGVEVSGETTRSCLWCQLSLVRENLGGAVFGQALLLASGNQPTLVHQNQTLTFWRRFTCPPNTPVQYKVNVKFQVLGIEIPMPFPIG